MDLGIAGRKALVTGASRGMGRACAEALATEGVDVTIVARRPEPLAEAAEVIRVRYGVAVATVAADIAGEDGRARVIAACPDPDILVISASGPAHGDFRDWTRADWIAALEVNMLAPILLMRATVDAMIARRFGRIVAISSRVARMAIPHLGLSAAARGGLAGFTAGLARECVRHNVTVNSLLPGAVDTDRLRANAERKARRTGLTVAQVLAAEKAEQPAGRVAEAHEIGAACAFLCGARAGYITGQSLLVDGGSFPGTL